MKKIQLALLGVGSHCHNEHLPSIDRMMESHGDRVELSAVCDLDRAKATQVAEEHGFARAHGDIQNLLEEKPDGIIAVTPTPVTAGVAIRILEAGIPLCMEKPLGVDPEEARKVADVAEATGTPVMVGLNRRFDPLILSLKSWLKDREAQHARVLLHRKGRREAGFIEDVLIHPVDVLSSLLGPSQLEDLTALDPSMGEALVAKLRFGSTSVFLECLPDVGDWREQIDVFGPRWHARLETTSSVVFREEGAEVIVEDKPKGIEGNGTCGETLAFVEGLLSGNLPGPTPSEVIQSMDTVQSIANAYREGRTSS